MAGYSENRGQNYEMKYMRKVLGQVDKRIKVPERVNGDALRALIEDFEQAPPRKLADRRKRLKLHAGIAYAAAFVLIAGLFYSMEFYKPEMINGGMRITHTQDPASSKAEPKGAPELQDRLDEAREKEAAGFAGPEGAASQAPLTEQEQGAGDVAAGSGGGLAELGVGGVESTLLLEQDGYAYYWRKNDASDPDKAGYPVTVEQVDSKTGQIKSQINVDILDTVEKLFIVNGVTVVYGTGEAKGAIVGCYDAEGGLLSHTAVPAGTLVDIRLHREMLYIAKANPEGGGPQLPEHRVTLPNSADESAVLAICALDLDTHESVTKYFYGANGSAQLHSLNAYILYQGVDGDGNAKDYIAQITLDGTDIALGPVS